MNKKNAYRIQFCFLMSVNYSQIELASKVIIHLKNPKYWQIFSWSEKAMAPHSSTLAWQIPWTEEPGRLQSMGSLGVRHD